MDYVNNVIFRVAPHAPAPLEVPVSFPFPLFLSALLKLLYSLLLWIK
jgi:hypothetical protein